MIKNQKFMCHSRFMVWSNFLSPPQRNFKMVWCLYKKLQIKKKKIQQSITEELSIKDTKINVTYFSVLLGCKKCNVPSATLRPLRNIILKYELLSTSVQPNQCIYFQNIKRESSKYHATHQECLVSSKNKQYLDF